MLNLNINSQVIHGGLFLWRWDSECFIKSFLDHIQYSFSSLPRFLGQYSTSFQSHCSIFLSLHPCPTPPGPSSLNNSSLGIAWNTHKHTERHEWTEPQDLRHFHLITSYILFYSFPVSQFILFFRSAWKAWRWVGWEASLHLQKLLCPITWFLKFFILNLRRSLWVSAGSVLFLIRWKLSEIAFLGIMAWSESEINICHSAILFPTN